MSKEHPTYNEIIFSQKQEQDIINMYVNQNLSTVAIGKVMGCNYNKISRVLKSYNIKPDGRSVRKHKLNELYFDSIDTPNKAYILGILYADGNVYPEKGTIFISLQEDDKEILEKMRIEIGSAKELKFIDNTNNHRNGYNYKNAYSLIFYSTYMCKSLILQGMMPNKSLKLEFPNISPELYKHFIRGYFDGDGSVYRYIKNENNKQVTVTITSTLKFCEKVKEILKNELGVYCGIYDASNHNGITKVISMSTSSSKKFLDWIYDDAELYMKRKYDRYIEYFYPENIKDVV